MALVGIKDLAVNTPVRITNPDLFTPKVKEGTTGIITSYNNELGTNRKYPTINLFDENSKTFSGTRHLFNAQGSMVNYKNIGFDESHEILEKLLDTDAHRILTVFQHQDVERAVNNLTLGSMYNLHLGCDPEIFVVDKDNKVIPAYLFLPEKTKAITFDDLIAGEGKGKITAFLDGFQAEFTTSAQKCLAWHIDTIRLGLKTILNTAKTYNKDAKLTIDSVVQIDQDVLKDAPQDYVIFGCTPSKNVYGASGTNITDPRSLPIRFAGGHIHFGMQFGAYTDKVIKALDMITGMMTVGMFEGIDSPARRMFYGLAGEHRLPAHGLEYRTLSNAWLCHPAVAHLVNDIARYALDFGYRNVPSTIIKEDDAYIQAVINNCDVEEARKYIRKYEKLFTRMVEHRYSSSNPLKAGKVALQMILEGVKSTKIDPTDIAGNWQLDLPEGSRYQTDGKFWVGHSEGPTKCFKTFSGYYV